MVYDRDQPVATARLLQKQQCWARGGHPKISGAGHWTNDYVGYYSLCVQQQHRPFLKLSSQVHAASFYEKLGFVTQGDQYDECGILILK